MSDWPNRRLTRVAPVPTPIQEIDDSHGELAALVRAYLPHAMTISVVSVNETEAGMMIMHDQEYDKAYVAKLLRTCADILERKP